MLLFFSQHLPDVDIASDVWRRKLLSVISLAMQYRIRQLRQAAGLTQEQLAHACGVTQSVVSQVERGRRTSMETLELFAKALDVELPDLFERSTTDAIASEMFAIFERLPAKDREFLLSMAHRLASER